MLWATRGKIVDGQLSTFNCQWCGGGSVGQDAILSELSQAMHSKAERLTLN
jgi:hypothetical protein